ncbi:hypothetical protein PMZ80_003446 [Knufia obscura]|uniref:Uncharacterized protein n=2 Tax=Knufia TaxID=430999 RepID=A0AAN8F260_9EURO|nr:hypothetical protein PMZ80_003446 [Knufia obscura]KAK5958636.1 hypothetical protein OHC33_000479 [Knufia fluminis]
MASSTIPTITESTILQSYLLHPSPLPTILPYSAFLTQVPTSYRDPEYASSLKRLYRDLQFRRAITVEQVRDNIERECGPRAATLRAKLARQIAIDEGDREADAEEEASRRKRRRIATNAERLDGEEAEDAQIKEEELSDGIDEFTDSRYLAAHQTLYDHQSSLHPAAHVLPLASGLDHIRSSSASAFHTKESLLSAIENATESLEREIEGLEAECANTREQISETVGGLSDLRYGKRHRESEDEEGGHQFGDVLEAIGEFRDVMKEKITA